jgi:hypothetical protein
MQTVNETVALNACDTEREPLILRKKIGSSTFIINVYTNPTAKETMQDKILRLIERESENLRLQNPQNYATMESLQTVRLPGGSE